MNIKMDEDEGEDEELETVSQYNFFIAVGRAPRLSLTRCAEFEPSESACMNNCDSIDAFMIDARSEAEATVKISVVSSHHRHQRWGRPRTEPRSSVNRWGTNSSIIHNPGLTGLACRTSMARSRTRVPSHNQQRRPKEAAKTINHEHLNVISVHLSLMVLLSVVASFTLSVSMTECREFVACNEISAFNETGCASRITTNRPRRSTLGHVTPRTPINRQLNNNEFLIQTKQGLFRGRVLTTTTTTSPRVMEVTGDDIDYGENNVIGFFGIRYASAPVKRLRFMPPTAFHYAQNQVHNMQYFGPICRQRWPIDLSPNSLVGQLFAQTKDSDQPNYQQQLSEPKRGQETRDLGKFSANDQDLQMRLTRKLMPKKSFNYLSSVLKRLISMEQSEDCLNLNIYASADALRSIGSQTPQSEKSQRPVLVIIHGESFDYGAGSTIDGQKLARDKRLLVVTFNYRLNILGFPPKMIGASRGNLGLMDQIAALHWIKDNIDSFGGSPTNITLMGSKRGAIFVNLLMLSPLARVPGLQHLRLLAKLCNCPIYQRLPTGGSPKYSQNQHEHHLLSTNTSKSRDALQMEPQKAKANLATGGHLDEARANVLMLECLRGKSIEQLLQPIPFQLLHYDQNDERLLVATRISSLAQDSSQLDSVPDSEPVSDQERLLDFGLDQELASFVDADERLMTRLALVALKNKTRALLASRSEPSERQVGGDLFDAIYGSPAFTIRPIFGPVVDGVIIAEDDPAAAMQRPNSSFSQRDLLIGLSQPIFASSSSQHHLVSAKEELMAADQLDEPSFELGPEHLMADIVTEQLERVGLSNGQAVELVNGFVRTFYRYHNQEIANSIINHYLGGESKVSRRLKAHRYQQAIGNLDHGANRTRAARQLLVLDSLFEAFQDALINVPVLRTSLLHATKQLDTIAEVFVGQQFEAWKTKQRGPSDSSNDDDEHSFRSDKILDAFTSFAQVLTRDSSWPLEIHSPSLISVQQPSATYLYQIDSLSLLNILPNVIAKLEAQTSAGFKLLKQTLSETLLLLQRSRNRHNFGFESLLVSDDATDSDDQHPTAAQIIARQFEGWTCNKMANLLFKFASEGRLNHKETDTLVEPVDLFGGSRMLDFESRCIDGNQSTDIYLHSVKLAKPTDPSLGAMNESCERELSRIGYDLLRRELEAGEQQSGERIVFSPFGQQVISMPYSLTRDSSIEQTNNMDEHQLAVELDQKASFSARASFWANYVPALNCSKTQPVIPTSLLTDQLSHIPGSNSTLLNLNLLFGCHQGGRTALKMIEELASSMSQQLKLRANQWRVTMLNHFPLQQTNHHILRMVNMNQSGALDDQPMDERSAQTIGSTSNQTEPIQLSTSVSHDLAAAGATSRDSALVKVRYLILVLMVCAGVVIITITSKACALIKRRRQSSAATGTSKSESQESSPEVNGSQAANDSQPAAARSSIVQLSGDGPESRVARTNQSTSFQGNRLVYLNAGLQQPSQEQVLDEDRSTHHQLAEHTVENVQSCGHEKYFYWDNSHASTFVDDSVCGHQVNDELLRNDGLTVGSQADCRLLQEPIMMPILTNGPTRIINGTSQRRSGRLTSESVLLSLPRDSSSETQGRSSASSTKKRVKINDGPSDSAMFKSRTLDRQPRNQATASDNPLYCPVHRDQMMQLHEQPQLLRSESFLCDMHFADQQNSNLWDGSYINLEPQGILKSQTNRACVMAHPEHQHRELH